MDAIIYFIIIGGVIGTMLVGLYTIIKWAIKQGRR